MDAALADLLFGEPLTGPLVLLVPARRPLDLLERALAHLRPELGHVDRLEHEVLRADDLAEAVHDDEQHGVVKSHRPRHPEERFVFRKRDVVVDDLSAVVVLHNVMHDPTAGLPGQALQERDDLLEVDLDSRLSDGVGHHSSLYFLVVLPTKGYINYNIRIIVSQQDIIDI